MRFQNLLVGSLGKTFEVRMGTRIDSPSVMNRGPGSLREGGRNLIFSR